MDKFNVISFILIMSGMFVLGWLGNSIYSQFSNERTLDGLRFERNMTEIEAEKFANNLDGYGDFVCVNVKGMSYERGLEVCKHEVAHEIFAEYCEEGNNIDKCMKITK